MHTTMTKSYFTPTPLVCQHATPVDSFILVWLRSWLNEIMTRAERFVKPA
jgi:hypothetical protein